MTCGIEIKITVGRFLNILFTFPIHLSTSDLIVSVAEWLLLMPCLLKLAISDVDQKTITVSKSFLGFSNPPVIYWKIILKILKLRCFDILLLVEMKTSRISKFLNSYYKTN